MEFITNNWYWLVPLVIAIAEVIVNLTPTEKDNSILNFIVKILDKVLPNKTKDGKKFKLRSNKE